MPFTIHIVGAGSLGSGIAIEIARRAGALKFPLNVRVYDDDEIEERNIYSQEFFPEHIGKKKAEVVVGYVKQYAGIDALAVVQRVTLDNHEEVMKIGKSDIILDLVDNIETRQMLHLLGVMYKLPVLHVSMDTSGNGNVNWNFDDYDTFHLSPNQLTPAKAKELSEREEEQKLPPCELNSHRGLIRNSVMAGVTALFIFLGKDVTKEVEDLTEGQDIIGILTNFHCTKEKADLIAPMTNAKDWEYA